jgi:hypothetical protein
MDDAYGGKPSLGEKAAKAKDTVAEKAQEGFSTVKDAALKAKEKATVAKEAVSAFADEARKRDLQGSAKQAVGTAGSAAREVGQAAKGEVQQTKERATGETGPDGSTSSDPTY